MEGSLKNEVNLEWLVRQMMRIQSLIQTGGRLKNLRTRENISDETLTRVREACQNLEDAVKAEQIRRAMATEETMG